MVTSSDKRSLALLVTPCGIPEGATTSEPAPASLFFLANRKFTLALRARNKIYPRRRERERSEFARAPNS